MRDQNDRVVIDVTIRARVSLDRERVIEDPAWAEVSKNYDLTKPEQVQQALYQYLGNYVIREQLFGGISIFMPSTNGPADLIVENMEEVTHAGI